MTESDLHVGIDNPLGVALLALVQAAAHPGDTLAQAHVAMTPLGDVLTREGLGSADALSRHVLGQIHAEGFESTLEHWVRRLEPSLAADDAFSRERGRQLVAAAALFDATGSREAAEFVAFVQRHTLRSVELAGVVRVMTIHKSKGLGFDLVIVPDLEGQRIDQRRDGLAVQRAADRTVEWVLDLPSKQVCAQDATLSAYVAAAEAEAGYEALALLYVGLTRAKRAMYVITKSPGKSESRNYPKLLALTLGDEPWSAGRADWFEGLRPAVPAGPESESVPAWAPTGRAPRRQARRASADKGGVVAARQLLALEGAAARGSDFGAAVHTLLAEVEWEGDPSPQTWPDRGLPAEVVAEALACVQAPALVSVWRRPAAGEVWRERAFEIVIDDAWVTGVFDRVVVNRREDGRAVAATVFDFKTDLLDAAGALATALDRHRGQLNLYRRVVAIMTGLPVTEVGCEVVFTTLRRSVTVP
jgi:ATP-dependent exoDNAse (exonuclease V) beta subunit